MFIDIAVLCAAGFAVCACLLWLCAHIKECDMLLFSATVSVAASPIVGVLVVAILFPVFVVLSLLSMMSAVLPLLSVYDCCVC